jgi:hypothetical protein
MGFFLFDWMIYAQADGGFASKNTGTKSGLPEGGSLSVVAQFLRRLRQLPACRNYRCAQNLWLTAFNHNPYFTGAKCLKQHLSINTILQH